MKKLIILALVLALGLTSIAGLVSCNDPKEAFLEINFYSEDIHLSSTQIDLADPKIPTFPTAPTKDGCTFSGWYFDSGVWEKPVTNDALETISEELYNSFLEEGEFNSVLEIYAKFDDATPPGDDVTVNNWWEAIPYASTTLLFQMTRCSNYGQLASGCEKYMSGENVEAFTEFEILIKKRNEDACLNTNATVKYLYYPDASDTYGWTKNVEFIAVQSASDGTESPDIYCNFITDMLSASLHGAFANLYSKSRGTGDEEGLNFLIKDETIKNEGLEHDSYMNGVMSSLSLSSDKIYCIASDYFIDIIRAFYAIPVNLTLYNSIAPDMIGDLNGDEKKDINDLFEEVKNGDWTYDRLLTYCAKIHSQNSDLIGFAFTDGSSSHSSAFMYSSSANILKKDWSEEKGGYVYYYPGATVVENADPEDTVNKKYSDIDYSATNHEFIQFFSKLEEFYNSNGVVTKYANEVITSFTHDTSLFGDVVQLGKLENANYQQMMGGPRGFGILPIPLYKTNDVYNTQFSKLGRCGGIARTTTKFAQCTAFIHYQSTHSTETLNEYYKINFGHVAGNIEMLQLLRKNATNGFYLHYDNILCLDFDFYNSTSNFDLSTSWSTQVAFQSYNLNMEQLYMELRDGKQRKLHELELKFANLPD